MLDSYRNRMAAIGGYDGEFRRRSAQNIMEASWMRDPATKPVYVKWVDTGLPNVDENDFLVYAKYNVKSYHNITGDEVGYLLQFRLEDISNNPDIKVGSYVYIPNEMNEYEWWIIVHEDDRSQFHQFTILKCTWTFKWISRIDGKRIIYNCLGAPRKQNSYNSGVWLDYTTQTVENQEVMWLPTNDDTKTITYDTNFLKSAPGRYPALKWTVSKIEDTAVDGISKFTMTQEMFDPAKDNVDLMIADYWEGAVSPELPETEHGPVVSDFEIIYSGQPSVRAGGGYKKFTLKERIDGDLVDATDDILWDVNFDSNQDKLEISTQDNIIRVKCVNDYSLIGKSFVITATYKNSSKSIIVEITSL